MATTALALLDGASVNTDRDDFDAAGHQLVLAARELVKLAADERELYRTLLRADSQAVRMVAAQLAVECHRAGLEPRGDDYESED